MKFVMTLIAAAFVAAPAFAALDGATLFQEKPAGHAMVKTPRKPCRQPFQSLLAKMLLIPSSR